MPIWPPIDFFADWPGTKSRPFCCVILYSVGPQVHVRISKQSQGWDSATLYHLKSDRSKALSHPHSCRVALSAATVRLTRLKTFASIR
jgi:hypothetical protein